MLIGDVSRKYNVPVDTLRYYDKIGLLTPTRRGAQRHYTMENLVRLESILQLKALMFSLDEARELLSLDEQVEAGLKSGYCDSEQLQALLWGIQAKHEQIVRKEQDLIKVKVYLEHLIKKIEGVMD